MFALIAVGGPAGAVGNFLPGECPQGTYRLQVQVLPDVSDARVVAVLVRSIRTIRPLPAHLYTRSDGWTHMSSEMAEHRLGVTVSNCFSEGLYHVRTEYYAKKPVVGLWLTAAYGYVVGIGDHEPVEFGHEQYHVGIYEHFSSHGLLFLFAAGIVAVVIGIAIALIRRARRP
ncbi:MAG: hypothetical protein A3I44_01615 [Candidatus Sungbacteria bacterium RIFCSPLOWO2_02_FULL_51_17]|uniref:Uncharacterized protein n=1 Tax=Candidatus Sungbacteria bacterium RIFCSPHIGHO2_02_FULL_51_29 TaxID=1802273 RepID=A0A1G2KYC3_9BACT|nr:MAG: hypothetical protein A2676_00780 [Candidatus Sungbacteria bacterium RIFCSPHIGHO2_01_FULL_51_22]OHA03481.1 MAG: hypothetical protein A3C16_00045 [Candidatus Sungbacteria bacterium RIFCSPHIGHO2_02_FULL_51_29]OHA10596.1 MAG: hypothetical protein A3I44_01615 [Candidatus Sungbacteria bacterium RIFCSPLOWO2_02_FULL_51_17]